LSRLKESKEFFIKEHPKKDSKNKKSKERVTKREKPLEHEKRLGLEIF